MQKLFLAEHKRECMHSPAFSASSSRWIQPGCLQSDQEQQEGCEQDKFAKATDAQQQASYISHYDDTHASVVRLN